MFDITATHYDEVVLAEGSGYTRMLNDLTVVPNQTSRMLQARARRGEDGRRGMIGGKA